MINRFGLRGIPALRFVYLKDVVLNAVAPKITAFGEAMNTSWGSDEDTEIDDELKLEVESLIPPRQRNEGDIGTRDFYDRQDRLAREIIERPR